MALSDAKVNMPDPPTQAPPACVSALPGEEGEYSEIGNPEDNYDKLSPYSNDNPEREPYAEFASRIRDVSKPTADSAYVNTSFRLGNEKDSKN